MPGQLKICSRMTAPLSSCGSVRPISVTSGISVLRKAWCQITRPRRHALGPRRADVVLADDFLHVRANEPAIVRQAAVGEADDRQERVLEDVPRLARRRERSRSCRSSCRTAAASRASNRTSSCRIERRHERRQRIEHVENRAHGPLVERAAAGRRPQADRNREQVGEQQRRDRTASASPAMPLADQRRARGSLFLRNRIGRSRRAPRCRAR